MYDVMIRCLRTGQLVSTGIITDEVSFSLLPDIPTRLTVCPACGGAHDWSKQAAIILKREQAA